ncbi:MAG TPA: hypothetical protein V6C69_22255 [Trichormus sp.]|jgi:hypothetical protein
MRSATKLFLSLAFAASLLAPNAIPAQSQNSSHGVKPYVCDVAGDYANGDFSVGLVNDHHHLVLEVQSFKTNNTTYFCENTGGVYQLAHPVHLESISAFVNTTGAITPADVYVEINVKGSPNTFYFNTTTARVGPTRDGYTFYTWRVKDLENLGLPSNPALTTFGFSVNVYTKGTGSIRSPFLNTTRVPFVSGLLYTCPFSDPSLCVK